MAAAESTLDAQIGRYEAAIDARALDAASNILDDILAARLPADGKPRPDPLLNGLLGQFYLAVQQNGVARMHLARATPSALPPSIRARVALARARSFELDGRRVQALAAFREAEAAAATEADKAAARTAAARLLLADDPAAAARMLAGLPQPDPESQWEAEAVLSAAASLSGDPASARRHFDLAWQHSLAAGPGALAPTSAAALGAALAAARRDHPGLRAMIAAANGYDVASTKELVRQLPMCGTHGITADDWVILAIAKGPVVHQFLLPVAASRPAVVAPFIDSISGYDLIDLGEDEAAGTAVRLACRIAMDSHFRPAGADDPGLAWALDAGLYPLTGPLIGNAEKLSLLARRIDDITARFGKDSPLLISAYRDRIAGLKFGASVGETVVLGQLTADVVKLAAVLRANNAPSAIVEPIAYNARSTQNGERKPKDTPEEMRAFAALLPARDALDMIDAVAMVADEFDPKLASELIVDLDRRMAEAFDGDERRAWLIRLAAAHRKLGNEKAAVAVLQRLRLPASLCSAFAAHPKLVSNDFSSDDYPTRLIAEAIHGRTTFDLTVRKDGSTADRRPIMAIPPLLFDAPSEAGFASLRYDPATIDGAPTACIGEVQSTVWKLEGDSPLPPPSFADPDDFS
ncbi:MAG: hypothetical protein ABIO68_00695 [Sphingomicrobium sp.]